MSGKTPVHLWATRPAKPGRYELHMARLRFGELFRMSPNILTALIAILLLKVLRLRHLGKPQLMDYPARLLDVEEGQVAPYLLPALREATEAVLALGMAAGWTYIVDSQVAKPAVGRVFLSPDGRSASQIMVLTDDSVPSHDGLPQVKLTVQFTSGRDGDHRVWTIDQPRDLDTPFEPFITRMPGASPGELWAAHQQTLAASERAWPILNEDIVRGQIEAENNRSMEIAIDRGLHVLFTG